MSRDEMIEVLFQAFVLAGDLPSTARRRLWRMSAPALRRELLLRGLIEYEDPPSEQDEDERDALHRTYSLLGWTSGPVYVD